MSELPSIGPEERKVLEALKGGKKTLEGLAKDSGFEKMSDLGAILGKLESKGLVKVMRFESKKYSLSDEGKKYAREGLPEERIVKALKELGGKGSFEEVLEKSGLEKKEFSIGLGWAIRKGYVRIEKGKKEIILISEKEDPFSNFIRSLKGEIPEKEIPKEVLREVKQRGSLFEVKEEVLREVEITELGREVLKRGEVEIGALTPEMLKEGSWRKVKFKRYDLSGYVGLVYCGREHPLTELIEKIREIFLSMGFKEIKGDYVQSSFWNMDALFTPQDHPARELQDTYYLKEPKEIKVDQKIAEKIKEVHENGGDTGSTGWKYEWSYEIAKKPLLTTHTTVLTVRYLKEHKDEMPIRVFSIGRVFRRENLDPTHLSEFTQIEGIILEKNASLRMLIGVLKEFYRRMGFREIKLRPSYFPYTEPSMEVFVKFGGSWLELGGSGIFRPEVTKPLGIEGRVLAWGLGLERLAAILLGLDDIRKLYLTDVKWLRMVSMRW